VWYQNVTSWNTGGITIEDVRISGGQQTAILLGAFGDVRIRRVTSDDGVLQGLGTLPLMVSYPLYIDQCNLSGRDAPIVSFWQMIEARGLQLSVVGRHGVRSIGGDCIWDGVKVWRSCPYTESVFRLVGQDDGLNHEIRHVMYDNEDWTPTSAILEVEQGAIQPGRVTVDGFAVSATGRTPFVRLLGKGVAAPYSPYAVSLRGMTCFGGCKVALRCDGPPSFSGDIDLSLLPGATVAGPAGAITVTPQSPLYRPSPPMPPVAQP
jgi:hypothetical protein